MGRNKELIRRSIDYWPEMDEAIESVSRKIRKSAKWTTEYMVNVGI
jgi:hypothetical protein